ncbi:MAG: helicase [Bacteroidales bacterium]|jgi:hypothetical protein|nr:helicase [Bacteroidales bacterium]
MSNNKEQDLAWRCITETDVNIFLTGRAGTGKTTFLKKLKAKSPKRMVVLAPTGVAAINAGGSTIHSFFQIAPGPYVPDLKPKYNLRREKVNLIRTLDLVVIDEISMVRADLLDAVDAALRHYRRSAKPFGGVQMLLIGDLQQLPPVVRDDERQELLANYDSPYFFSSKAMMARSYVTIELQKVYRQQNANFINLLNAIRDNNLNADMLDLLNSRYQPDFKPRESEHYIRLTTHNASADEINYNFLHALKRKAYTYECVVEGTFPETSYPAEKELMLKKGAQVMFLRNDAGGLYYNGKIGYVTDLTETTVEVTCPGDERPISVAQETWTNTRYELDEKTKEIREHVEGKFMQIPLRLAWAITIHKSQGLTFEHAIIDAQKAFAHGQVYVALSRCRTLEGLVLSTPISRSAIKFDNMVTAYSAQRAQHEVTESSLTQMSINYAYNLIADLFDFTAIVELVFQLKRIFDESYYKKYPHETARIGVCAQEISTDISIISQRFMAQLEANRQSGIDIMTDEKMLERIKNGAKYFNTKLSDQLGKVLDIARLKVDNKANAERMTQIRNDIAHEKRIKLVLLSHVSRAGFDMKSVQKKKLDAILTKELKKSSEGSASISLDIRAIIENMRRREKRDF